MKLRFETWQKLFLIVVVSTIPLLVGFGVILTCFLPGAIQEKQLTGTILAILALSVGISLSIAYFIAKRVTQALQLSWTENKILKNNLKKIENKRNQLLETIIVSQEEERKRISRELHDETGQSLTSLMLGLKLIQEAESLQKAKELSNNLREIVYKTIEEIQWLSYELRPSTLDDLGLLVALRRYIDELTQHKGVIIDFEIDNFLKNRLNAAVETTFYRVVQEALTNVIRHAKANKIKVQLGSNSHNLYAVIEDDGVGFDLEQMEKGQQKNLGLIGMKERAALVGGELLIHTAAGEGTRITLTIPIKMEKELCSSQQSSDVDGEKNGGNDPTSYTN